jgi:hypothetical protein
MMEAVSATQEELEAVVWTIRRGYDWDREFVLTSGSVAGWEQATMVAQIRSGPDEGDTLVASSVSTPGVPSISLADTDLTAATPKLGLRIAAADTANALFALGTWYWLELKCRVDGNVVPVMRKRVAVAPRVVV